MDVRKESHSHPVRSLAITIIQGVYGREFRDHLSEIFGQAKWEGLELLGGEKETFDV